MSGNTMSLEELTDFASDVANAAINQDRATEKRFWEKLQIIMNSDNLDFEKAMPTFIQLISQFGEIKLIPLKLFSNMHQLAQGLNDTRRNIVRHNKFPELAYTPIVVSQFRYRQLKNRWIEYVTLAIQAANLKTEAKMGLVETIALMKEGSGGDF